MPMIVELLLTGIAATLIGIADTALSISRRANRATARLLLWMDEREGI